jgi:ribosomal protein S27AE
LSSTVNQQPCPRCGQQVSVTTANLESGDQLAVDRTECPNCGAHLARDIEGHADRGWRLAETSIG